MFDDLKDARLIYLKGFLFLLAVAIWAFCRFYYFAFYVIERWVDPSYRFNGLGSFVLYLFRRKIANPPAPGTPEAAPPFER